jgi:hypothetical protein
MSINAAQLREHVIRPTLKHLDLWSQAAENLVLGTILTESRGEYLKQVGTGPALGLIQMEPATHDDIWNNHLKYQPVLSAKLRELETPAALTKGALELIGNLYYAAAMCRVFYRRLPDPLPAADDPEGMARLWKKRYNTPLGAGTVEKALPYFRQACADVYGLR